MMYICKNIVKNITVKIKPSFLDIFQSLSDTRQMELISYGNSEIAIGARRRSNFFLSDLFNAFD